MAQWSGDALAPLFDILARDRALAATPLGERVARMNAERCGDERA